MCLPSPDPPSTAIFPLPPPLPHRLKTDVEALEGKAAALQAGREETEERQKMLRCVRFVVLWGEGW